MFARADHVVDLEVADYSAGLQLLPRAGRQGVGGDLAVWDRDVPAGSWLARRREWAIAERANPSTSAEWQTLQRLAPSGSLAMGAAFVWVSERAALLVGVCASPGYVRPTSRTKVAKYRIFRSPINLWSIRPMSDLSKCAFARRPRCSLLYLNQSC
jgi:hypothetical protein